MEIKNQIIHTENVEKYIAIKNGHLGKHEKKWARATPRNYPANTPDTHNFVLEYLDKI